MEEKSKRVKEGGSEGERTRKEGRKGRRKCKSDGVGGAGKLHGHAPSQEPPVLSGVSEALAGPVSIRSVSSH